MQTYPVRASHRRNLAPEGIAEALRPHFDGVELVPDGATAHWGAVERLVARADGRGLSIELTMNPKVAADVAAETVTRYNRFLESATGYTAKERARRLRKSAGEAPAGT